MSYYNHYGIECFQLIKLFIEPLEGECAFYFGNVIKYIYRAGLKSEENELLDIKKALHYFDIFLKSANASNKSLNLKGDFRLVNYLIDCFYKMPRYKEIFFTQLLYAYVKNDAHSLQIIYKDLEQNTKELEG